MTAMPQLVAAFHSLVGLAAGLRGGRGPERAGSLRDRPPGAIYMQSLIEMSIGVAIGAVTFSGSLIAFAKLNGNMSGEPILLPARHIINLALAVGLIVLIVLFVQAGSQGQDRLRSTSVLGHCDWRLSSSVFCSSSLSAARICRWWCRC